MIETQIDDRLSAAKSGDKDAFSELVEPYRPELLIHCYRMFGAVEDAEDMVQETFLRAWNRLDRFTGGLYFRAWLYKIATNICLDTLEKRSRRILSPSSFPSSDPSAPFPAVINEPVWIEPFPDELMPQVILGPEARSTSRESITLAFLAALQLLPPRQRLILILNDVLDWRTREVAMLLDITDSAVSSALHRARITLKRNYGSRETGSIDEKRVGAVLKRYVDAWEAGDVDNLIALMTDKVIFTMPPRPAWFSGRAAVRIHVNAMLPGNARNRWRLLQTRANHQTAIACYRRDERDERYHPHALQVITFENMHMSEIQMFVLPRVFPRFGLPMRLEG